MGSIAMTRVKYLISAVAALALTACESLPRSGPDAEEIVAGARANGGGMNIVMADYRVAAASEKAYETGFSSAFLTAGQVSTDIINPGDTLTVTVWENVDNGLLANVGQKVTSLETLQVDQLGQIFVPYAGNIVASGNTPDQLRDVITRRLDTQTPDPQVEVRRTAGDGSSVTVIGGVGSQGIFPIEPSTRTLTSMLAEAGGVNIEADVAQIVVRRGSQSGRIFLRDLYDKPSLDIPLRGNDKIIVEEDRRTFTSLGATGAQSRVKFPQGRINVIEALATVGGLNSTAADPTGIFIFRREPASIGAQVTGRTDIGENEPFAYLIDLTKPEGIFIAREFQIRDEDTIYVTEAPFVAWAKVLEATAQTLNFLSLTANTVSNFSGN